MAAVLYMVVQLAEKRQQGLLVCTSNPNKWLQPRKRVISPQKVCDRPLRKQSKYSAKAKVVLDVNRLKNKLEVCCPQAGLVHTMNDPDQINNRHVEVKLPPVTFSFADWIDLKTKQADLENYADSLVMSQSERDEVELVTRGQKSSSAWHEARCGRLTASTFGAVVKRQEKTPPDNLVKQVMQYHVPRTVPSMKWGIDHERAASRAYGTEMRERRGHSFLTVAECGLLVDKDRPYLGASPDGLVSCPDCTPPCGLLEIKCPWSCRSSTVAEACASADFCCELRDGKVALKRDSPYFYQIQGQMGISGRTWADFVVWTPKDNTNKTIHIERIYFDSKLWSGMKVKLHAFFVKGVAAEMFSSRVKRGISLY